MDGILLFNKPILWTSHDAVDFIRRRLGQKSVGHAGTLDPLATGLLVVLLGKATKLSGKLSDLDKDYAGTMTLGITTDTQDMEGKILSAKDSSGIAQAQIEKALALLCGEQVQEPPAYSAVRKNGRKLYDWARRGVSVEVAGKKITVSKFELIGFLPPEAYFFLTCSKGTYVRSLCDLAGRHLGCGATLSSLVRTRVGGFLLKDALDQRQVGDLTLGQIEKKLVMDESLSRT
jgi:tRNA pseudouridine55 synthase